MLISHSHRFIFFHVAKTAGMSIRAALLPYAQEPERFKIQRPPRLKDGQPNPFYEVWEALLLHATAADARRELPSDIFDDYYKFAFVRNPWDWHVSMYHFILREPSHIKHALIRDRGSFAEYLNWVIQTPRPYPKGATRTQNETITDADGKLLVDFVGRYEHVAQDFQQICQHIQVEVDLPHVNKSSHRDYRAYYTDHTRQLVADHFADDIALFGYTFDGELHG